MFLRDCCEWPVQTPDVNSGQKHLGKRQVLLPSISIEYLQAAGAKSLQPRSKNLVESLKPGEKIIIIDDVEAITHGYNSTVSTYILVNQA